MSEQSDERTYSDQEVEARLREELPEWYLEKGWIRRKYNTSGWKGTLMVINAVGHLAEAAWHHPDISASYAFVVVKLMNHDAKGVTEKDFELEKKIEEVIMWQPGIDENRKIPLGLSRSCFSWSCMPFRMPASAIESKGIPSVIRCSSVRSPVFVPCETKLTRHL